jgi:phosphate transport system substrate-binding protein
MKPLRRRLVRHSSNLIGVLALAGLTLAACSQSPGTAQPSTAGPAKPAATVALAQPTTASAPKPTVAPARPTGAPTRPAATPVPATAVLPKPTATPAQAAAATTKPLSNWTPREVTTDVVLAGEGVPSPTSLYKAWGDQYKKIVPKLSVTYQSVGNDQDVPDLGKGTIDFGATDTFLTDPQLTTAPGLVQVPIALDAVIVAYNLPGVTTLKLSPETLAAIYSGSLKMWDDPKIAADNPGVTLPKEAISVLHRLDESGTTALFTSYLSSVSSDWKTKAGEGTTVKRPVGTGAAESAGMAKAIHDTKGGIGYLEQAYALSQTPPLAAAMMKNAAGSFVSPTAQSVSAAAESFVAKMPADMRMSIVNPQGNQAAYPISGMTFTLLEPKWTGSSTPNSALLPMYRMSSAHRWPPCEGRWRCCAAVQPTTHRLSMSR